MYLTFQEYTSLGFNKVLEEEFVPLMNEAERLIRYRTMNRSEEGINSGFSREIKDCMCLLIDNFKERNKALNELEQGLEIARKGVSSESVTDHSVSYSKLDIKDTDETNKSFQKKSIRIIQECLMWTGLLYRGI